MDEQVSNALGKAIEKALPIAEQFARSLTEPHLIWHRVGDRSWNSRWEQRPSVSAIFSQGERAFAEISEPFTEIFLQKYPKYSEGFGLSTGTWVDLFHHRPEVFTDLLWHVYRRQRSFTGGPEVVQRAVGDFSAFVDEPTIPVHFQAELLNFHSPLERLDLPEGLAIRRLSDEEITDIYGGAIHSRAIAHRGFGAKRPFGPLDFVIEGEYNETPIVGRAAIATSGYDDVRSRLDKAMLALRTFKEGRVGYESIRFEPVGFCPLSFQQIGFGDLYVPWGTYVLETDDAERLRLHAELVMTVEDSAMKMALFRLSDAQMRVRPEDRLVDAVIGLEALLLAALGKDDRRGELKYRFSINYASLFEGAKDRHRAFRRAKDLYDLRSIVAHGSAFKVGDCRVGEETVDIDAASKRACDALRWVVSHFLASVEPTRYKNPQFWEKQYFGL